MASHFWHTVNVSNLFDSYRQYSLRFFECWLTAIVCVCVYDFNMTFFLLFNSKAKQPKHVLTQLKFQTISRNKNKIKL